MGEKFDWESELTEVDSKIDALKEMFQAFGNNIRAANEGLSSEGAWGVLHPRQYSRFT